MFVVQKCNDQGEKRKMSFENYEKIDQCHYCKNKAEYLHTFIGLWRTTRKFICNECRINGMKQKAKY